MKTTSLITVFALPLIAAQLSYVTHIYNLSTETLYRFHQECRSYAKAKWVCEEEGGHLAIINSDQEAAHLGSLFQQNHPDRLDCEAELYVGAHFDEATGQFRTLEGQSLADAGYAAWAEGEPNNRSLHSFGEGGEQCVTMFRNLRLNDLYCGLRRPFVCEIPGYVYSRETDSLYKFHEQQVTKPEALSICSAQGGHVADIANEAEANAVSDLYRRLFVKYQTVALVGLHYDSARPSSMITYNEDNTIERNEIPIFILSSQHSRECNAIDLHGLLVKVDCSKKYFFICEMDRQTHTARGVRHDVSRRYQ